MAEEAEENIEELWDSIPEYGESEGSSSVPDESEPVEEEDEEIEDDYEEEEEEEDSEPEEDPSEESREDWEERYKNLESSHSRRGNEVYNLKEERDNLRLEKLELAQRLQEIESNKTTTKEEPAPPDPYDDEQYWSEAEREVLKEYPDVFAIANKIAQREAARSAQGIPRDDSAKEELAELREVVAGLGDHFTRNRAFEQLDESVGPVWREVDKDNDFFDFVNAKKVYYRAMSEGDLEEKAEVFNAYLDTDAGRRKYGQEEPEEEETSPAPRQNQRRAAAQGLVSGKKSRGSKPRGKLVGDDLWDSIPDPE